MVATTRTTAVGVFEDRERAQRAVRELRQAGFRDDQIGVTSRGEEHGTGAVAHSEKGTHAEEGAVAGLAGGAGVGALWGLGIMAGILPAIGPVIAGGTLAAIIASAATGAAAAGLAGALVGMGIPEEEANYYESEFQSGRTIVSVDAGTRFNEANAILNQHSGYDWSRRSTRTPTV